MRIAARIEPTKHVIGMVEFAEAILKEARDRGLLHNFRRKYRRRKANKKVVTKGKSKGKKAVNPLEEVE